MSNFNGLTNVNVELTSRCNKKCAMCGRRKIEREYPHLANWGDMDYEMVKSIAAQIPSNVVVQFHDNGEPLLYPALPQALDLFSHTIRTLDTNGKLLMERLDDIVDRLETITISRWEGDPEVEEQEFQVWNFIQKKAGRKPWIIFRCLGDCEPPDYLESQGLIARRAFHSPMGNVGYTKDPVVPEIGICINMLTHLVIKRDGKVHPCVTFDPEGLNVIGDLNKNTLEEIWNGSLRQEYVQRHIRGGRDTVPLCAKCDYWGFPVA